MVWAVNWLFLTLIGAIGLGVVWTKRRATPASEPTKRGEVPGYSVTGGKAFALDPVETLERGVDWWPESVEEFHSRDRARIVLRFGLRDAVVPDDVRTLLEASAREVAQRTNAHVVYVEGHTLGRLRAVYIWAPDGRGWSGGDTRSEVWFSGDEQVP